MQLYKKQDGPAPFPHSNRKLSIRKIMSSLSRIARTGSRILSASASRRAAAGRGVATSTNVALRRAGISVGVLLAGSALAYGGSRWMKREDQPRWSILPNVMAASVTHQPSVIAENKLHSLYIWIHLKPTANVKECAKVAATLQAKVKQVEGPDADDDDSIAAGVGFGPNFYKLITNGTGAPENYTYPHRKGYLGPMPSTGGDIFIHAKSSNYSKLYELAQAVMRSFPEGSIDKAEDIYGWTYQEGRDLSGFIDGTENPAEDEDRIKVGVDKTGGSYCITQRWIHKFDVIQGAKDRILENWVGRSKADSVEQTRKSQSAHVARMVGTNVAGQKKPFEMVRHSQPYGTVCGESGLFFIGYAASPASLEFMLDRMVGCDKDCLCDDIMRVTGCVSGNYWYFPSQEKLKSFL